MGRASDGPGARLTLGWGWILQKLLSNKFPLVCGVLYMPWFFQEEEAVRGKTIPARDPILLT